MAQWRKVKNLGISNARYVFLRSAYHKAVKNAEKKYNEQKCLEMVEEALEKGIQSFYSKMKDRTNGSCVDTVLFVDYLEELFNKEETDNNIHVESCELENDLMKLFTKEEIQTIFKSLKSKGKSVDGISPRDLRDLEELAIDPLVSILNDVLISGEFPSCWLMSKVLFLHKNGDRKEPSNYRTIQIQQAVLKLFTKAMAQRLHVFLEDNALLHNTQFAYRKSLSTAGPVIILSDLAKRTLNAKHGRKLYTAFIDFTKEFNRKRTSCKKIETDGFTCHVCGYGHQNL